MNNNLKIARELVELFGESAFYCMNIWNNRLNAQGIFDQNILARCKKDGYQITIEDNGFITLFKDNITITLTQ